MYFKLVKLSLEGRDKNCNMCVKYRSRRVSQVVFILKTIVRNSAVYCGSVDIKTGRSWSEIITRFSFLLWIRLIVKNCVYISSRSTLSSVADCTFWNPIRCVSSDGWGLWRINCKGRGRKLSWPILGYAPGICPDRLRETGIPPDNCRKVTVNWVVSDFFLSDLPI